MLFQIIINLFCLVQYVHLGLVLLAGEKGVILRNALVEVSLGINHNAMLLVLQALVEGHGNLLVLLGTEGGFALVEEGLLGVVGFLAVEIRRRRKVFELFHNTVLAGDMMMFDPLLLHYVLIQLNLLLYDVFRNGVHALLWRWQLRLLNNRLLLRFVV